MSDFVQPPLALLEGFAETWCTLAGGTWERQGLDAGHLVVWCDDRGRRESLPDRMYGLVMEASCELTLAGLPKGVSINLPPGLSVEGAQVHAVGHQLAASTREEAWGALRRVGRQGVMKARRSGCVVDELEDSEYYDLVRIKAERLGGRAPHEALLPTLRRVFGRGSVRLTGVKAGRDVAAAVLALQVDDYGMLVDGSSDRAHWDKNPNNLAVWSALGSLVDAGCRVIDYGFSAPGAGDLRFKGHMGGRELPLYRVVA